MELPWLPILHDSLLNRPEGPLVMTLATVDHDGVDARTMVCRDIGADGSLWFATDLRSRKIELIRTNPRVAVVLWLPHCRRQFRFRAVAILVTDRSSLNRTWQTLSDATKESFFWAEPGSSRCSIAIHNDKGLTTPPDTFGLLKVDPVSVDLLELEFTPHRRRCWRAGAAAAWHTEELNP